MKKAIKKEHCPHCDTIIDDVENVVDTDVTNLNPIKDEFWEGNYYLTYKVCPNCGENAVTYEWWNNYEGYEIIREKTK